jgi:hypothetical protein
MLPANLTKKQINHKTTEELERILEHSSYHNRTETIGNNQTIQYVFEVLHERKEIDCETAYCFEECRFQ